MTNWLPEGKAAAVCFTIDDIHPGRSTDAYEAGGDLQNGALGHVLWLLERQPQLHVTLFTTPDWRQTSPVPTRKIVRRIPWVREHVFLAQTLPAGTLSVANHPEFVRFLNRMPRTEIAFHGLHHLHRGPQIPVEFQEQSREECAAMLRKAKSIFDSAGLHYSLGIQPPGWNLTPELAEACSDIGLKWVASARDILTQVEDGATTAMSGLRGVSLFCPERINDRGLVHFASNFQATSTPERAFEILDRGGCLAVKAHIVKNALGHIALDGVDRLYMNYLNVLFDEIHRRYGERIWWTSMGQITNFMNEKKSERTSVPD